MVDVFVAEERGYFDELCLDVEVVASFSTANYPLIAGGEAQFASGGSFSEVHQLRHRQRRRPRRRRRRGPLPDRRLDPQAGHGRDARGPRRDDDRRQGQDPPERRRDARRRRPRRGRGLPDRAARRVRPARPHRHRRHRRVPRLQEQRAGRARPGRDRVRPVRPDRLRRPRLVRRDLHEPPVRRASTRPRPRTSCGRRCAASPTPSPIRRPPRRSAFDLAEAGGNPSFLSAEGETFRWETDAELLRDVLRRGRAVRRPRPRRCCRPRSTPTTEVGLFTEELPESTAVVDVDLAASVYDDNAEVIWPQ